MKTGKEEERNRKIDTKRGLADDDTILLGSGHEITSTTFRNYFTKLNNF